MHVTTPICCIRISPKVHTNTIVSNTTKHEIDNRNNHLNRSNAVLDTRGCCLFGNILQWKRDRAVLNTCTWQWADDAPSPTTIRSNCVPPANQTACQCFFPRLWPRSIAINAAWTQRHWPTRNVPAPRSFQSVPALHCYSIATLHCSTTIPSRWIDVRVLHKQRQREWTNSNEQPMDECAYIAVGAKRHRSVPNENQWFCLMTFCTRSIVHQCVRLLPFLFLLLELLKTTNYWNYNTYCVGLQCLYTSFQRCCMPL